LCPRHSLPTQFSKPKTPGCRVEDATSVSKCHDGCASGDLPACTVEAVFYDDGLRDLDPSLGQVSLDEEKAASLFEKACSGGDVNGCAFLGTAYMEGRGKPQDKARGVKLFQEWCAKGSNYACDRLAFAYVSGDGVPKDHAQAGKLYDQACSAGFLYACVQRGDMFKHGWGVARSDKEASDRYERACKNGEGYGCAMLADDLKGRERFDKAKQACDLQGFYGCYVMGDAYLKGDGVAPNPQEAVRLFRFACLNGGEEDACNALGHAYVDGTGGLPRDPAQARAFYQRGCGESPVDGAAACLSLADAYATAVGGAADPARAASLRASTCAIVRDLLADEADDFKDECSKAARKGGAAASTATASTAAAPPGAVLLQPTDHADLCVDVPKAGGVQLHHCHGRSNQRWSLEMQPDGAARVIGLGGQCLDPRSTGSNLEMRDCADHPARYKLSAGRLREATTGRCLTAAELSARSRVFLTKCDPANKAQLWTTAP